MCTFLPWSRYEYSPAPGEVVLLTSTTSAFASTGLEQILKNMHVVYPIFVGSFTDGCLGLTAADSISRGFLPTVVGDASLGSCRVSHLSMLRLFDQHWGRVRSAAEIEKEIEKEELAGVNEAARFPRKPRLGPAHMSPRAQRAEQRHARNAATMVQTHWRGKQARDAHQDRMSERREQEAAAVKIQSVYRGSVVRRPIPDADSDEEEEVVVVAAAPLPPGLRAGAAASPPEDEHLRALLHDAIANPASRVRVSPYTSQTEIQMSKPAVGGFGVGVKESPVTGMMTVNRVAPGGVAEVRLAPCDLRSGQNRLLSLL